MTAQPDDGSVITLSRPDRPERLHGWSPPLADGGCVAKWSVAHARWEVVNTVWRPAGGDIYHGRLGTSIEYRRIIVSIPAAVRTAGSLLP